MPKKKKHKNKIVKMNIVNMFLSSGFLCKIAILVKSISIESAKQLTKTSVIACVNLRYCKLKSPFKKKRIKEMEVKRYHFIEWNQKNHYSNHFHFFSLDLGTVFGLNALPISSFKKNGMKCGAISNLRDFIC